MSAERAEQGHDPEDRVRYPQVGRQERRHDALDQRDERGPEDRPAERSRTAYQDGDEGADGVTETGVLRRDEARRVGGQSARDAGDGPRQHESGEAKARRVVPECAHPAFVLADADQRSSVCGPRESPDRERDKHERDRNEDVHEIRCAEVETREHGSADARETVRTAGHRRPLKRDREDDLREREGQHQKEDSLGANDENADEESEKRSNEGRGAEGDRELVGREALARDPRRICARAEERGVAQRRHAGSADEEIERQCEDRQDERVADDRGCEARRPGRAPVGERHESSRGRRDERPAQKWSHRAMRIRPSSPVGFRRSTSATIAKMTASATS